MTSGKLTAITRSLVATAVVLSTLVFMSVPGHAEFPSDCVYGQESNLSTFVSLDYDESNGSLSFGGQVTCYGGAALVISELSVFDPAGLVTTYAPPVSCASCETVRTSEAIANRAGYFQVVMKFQVNGGEVLSRSGDFFHTGFGEPFQSCTDVADASIWGCFL